MSELNTLQHTLEELFDKHRLMPFIRSELRKEVSILDAIERNGLKESFAIDLMAQMLVHRKCSPDTLVGCLFHHFKDAQVTADEIELCCEADLVDFNTETLMFTTVIEPDAEMQKALDRYQFPLPLVIEPKKLTANDSTGYHHIKGTSVILRDNHHMDDVNLEHLNRMNAIPLALNHTVAKYMSNQWKGIDQPKEGETRQEYNKRVKAFQKYDSAARANMALIGEHTDRMWLTHAYDTRGRTYCVGYFINYQGNSWCKANVEFADKEIIE